MAVQVAPHPHSPAPAWSAGELVHGLRVRLRAARLDARIAAGEAPNTDPDLARRAAQLVSMRCRRRVAAGLERVARSQREQPVLSAAIPVDSKAAQVARPVLAQLAAALRSRERIHPRGMAITQLLLSEPLSALYWPAHHNEVYEVAREALFALGADEVPVRGRAAVRPGSRWSRRGGRSRPARVEV